MGIPIHYTLITDDYETVLMSIMATRKAAEEAGYSVEDVRGGLIRLR